MYTLPLFPPESSWKPPKEIPEGQFRNAKIIGIDTETKDPGLPTDGPGFLTRDSELVGISLYPDGGVPVYVPFQHSEGNVTDGQWVKWVRDVLESDQTVKIGANILYDVEALHTLGIELGGKWCDIQLTQTLLDEEQEGGYSLENLARVWLNKHKDETLLVEAAASYGFDPKADLWRLPAKYVGPYAEQDALLPVKIYEQQLRKIEDRELLSVLELEEKLLKICWEMRKTGVRVDIDKAVELSTFLEQKEQKLFNDITESSTGFGSIDLWSSKQLAQLMSQLGIDYPLTEKGNPSISNQVLANSGIVLLEKIAEFRKTNKLRRDFIEKGILHYEHNGRIHSQWHQARKDGAGTRSGRFSSSHPNHQQWPVRDPEIGARLRSCFLPENGQHWYKGDYASQEPRLTVHFAYACEKMGIRGCAGAETMVDAFHANPRLDMHQWTADLCGIDRRPAKSINLGLIYGMGKAKMARELGVDQGTVEQYLAKYHQQMPFMKGLANLATKTAESRGYVKTILGRHRHFKDAEFCHKALNATIQGSAADMTKKAIVDIWEQLKIIPMLTVHDELDVSVPDKETAKQIEQCMVHALELSVPVVVDSYLTSNWGECK